MWSVPHWPRERELPKVWLKDKIVLGERYKRGEGEVEWRGVRK